MSGKQDNDPTKDHLHCTYLLATHRCKYDFGDVRFFGMRPPQKHPRQQIDQLVKQAIFLSNMQQTLYSSGAERTRFVSTPSVSVVWVMCAHSIYSSAPCSRFDRNGSWLVRHHLRLDISRPTITSPHRIV